MASSRTPLFRDTDAGETLEVFFVSAILAILAIRGILAATGYPELGGRGLHVAHMLWGGIAMLVAILLLLSFWSVSVRWLAAFVGGVGFGTFIDELGKFVTDDNNYFFRPTFALIYVLFIGLYLLVRAMAARHPVTDEVRALNQRIRAEQGRVEATPGSWLRGYVAFRRRLAVTYRRIVSRSWFLSFLLVAFVAMILADGLVLLRVVEVRPVSDHGIRLVQALSVLANVLLVLIGLVRLPFSRLAALRWFQRGLVVSIVVTRVYVFVDDQLAALGGLLVDALLYVAVTFAIDDERARRAAPARATVESAAAAAAPGAAPSATR